MTADPLLDRMVTSAPPGRRSPAPPTRPAYREEAPYKIHGGCGLMGICDESRHADERRGGHPRDGRRSATAATASAAGSPATASTPSSPTTSAST